MTASTSSFVAVAELDRSCHLRGFGVWPVTLTPVRTSILRRLNERSTTLTTSLSTPGRICGSASRIVTSAPRSLIIEANSQPMAPPPMTATLAGSSVISNTSSEVNTVLPSTSKPGMVRGTEPEARITASPVSSLRLAARTRSP